MVCMTNLHSSSIIYFRLLYVNCQKDEKKSLVVLWQSFIWTILHVAYFFSINIAHHNLFTYKYNLYIVAFKF